MKNALRKAKPEEYEAWLRLYLKAKGKITYIYPYKLSDQINWFTAYKNFTVEARHGASAINILVPSYVTVNQENGIGHNQLYFMSNIYSKTFDAVPLFSDTNAFF